MNNKISHYFSILKRLILNNKKKALTSLLLMFLMYCWRNKQKIFKFDYLLNKMNQKFMKQMEQYFSEESLLREKLVQLDQARHNFMNSNYKEKMIEQINNFFSIDEIKGSLKNKNLTSSEKQIIWDSLKSETVVLSIFTIIGIPLYTATMLIKEILLQKNKNYLINKYNDDSLTHFESIFDSFAKHISNEGLMDVLEMIKQNLQNDIKSIKITDFFTINRMNQLYHSFEEKNLNFIKFEDKDVKNNYKKNILNILNPKKLINNIFGNSEKLSIPIVLLENVQKYLKNVKNHKICSDSTFLTKFIENIQEEEKEEDFLNFLKEKNNTDSTKRENLCTDISKICNEMIDWFESKNFQILLFYHIKMNFFKFRNRIILNQQKHNSNENIAFFNYITILYRITKEEFLDMSADDNNNIFYKNKLKHNLGILGEDIENEENKNKETALNFLILKEYELKLNVEEGWTEFSKRILLENDKYFNNIGKKENNEGGEDIMALLKQLG